MPFPTTRTFDAVAAIDLSRKWRAEFFRHLLSMVESASSTMISSPVARSLIAWFNASALPRFGPDRISIFAGP